MLFSWRVFSVSCGVSLSPLCDEFSHICALRLSLRKLTLIARLEDDHDEAWGRGAWLTTDSLRRKQNETSKFAIAHHAKSLDPETKNQEELKQSPTPAPHGQPAVPASRPSCSPPLHAMQVQTVFTSKRVGSINICFFSACPLLLLSPPLLE